MGVLSPRERGPPARYVPLAEAWLACDGDGLDGLCRAQR